MRDLRRNGEGVPVVRALLAVACVLAWGALAPGGPAHAQGTPTAALSWTASGSGSTDLASPSATQSLYVLFTGIASWRGAEIDLIWDPAGDNAGCVTHTGTVYPTSASCSALNRGQAVPVVLDDSPGHLHMAWANTEPLAGGCTGGTGVVLQFAFDGCASAYSGCFALTSAIMLDAAYEAHTCLIAPRRLTVAGSRNGSCGPETRSTTWGKVKAIYSR